MRAGWVRSGAMADDWTVWREDDHGNTFAVGVFATESEAASKLSELEGGDYPHRQTYWIERPTDDVAPLARQPDDPGAGGTRPTRPEDEVREH
jgi:hypothetical protein